MAENAAAPLWPCSHHRSAALLPKRPGDYRYVRFFLYGRELRVSPFANGSRRPSCKNRMIRPKTGRAGHNPRALWTHDAWNSMEASRADARALNLKYRGNRG